MGKLLAVSLSELRRQTIATFLFVVMWVCALCGLIMVVGGVFIKQHITDKIRLIQGYNSNTLLSTLVVVGLSLSIIDTIGGKLFYDLTIPEKRKDRRVILVALTCFLILMDLTVFASSIMCFVHQVHLRTSFHHGLMDAMIRYGDNDTIKFEIDFLQMEFQCCGNEGYEDWFQIQWINNAFLNLNDPRVQKKMTDGLYLNDDVPFSCCDPLAWRPCIHHHVHDNRLHYNYDFYKGVTLHTVGCKHRLMEFFGQKLQLVGWIVTVISLIQGMVVICVRYLQTSIEGALITGDPEATSLGYIWDTGRAAGHLDREARAGLLIEESDFTDSTFDDDFDEDDDEEMNQTYVNSGQREPTYGNLPATPANDKNDSPQTPEPGGTPSPGKNESKKQSKKDKKKSAKKSPRSQKQSPKGSKKPSSKSPNVSSKRKPPCSTKKASPVSRGSKKQSKKGKDKRSRSSKGKSGGSSSRSRKSSAGRKGKGGRRVKSSRKRTVSKKRGVGGGRRSRGKKRGGGKRCGRGKRLGGGRGFGAGGGRRMGGGMRKIGRKGGVGKAKGRRKFR